MTDLDEKQFQACCSYDLYRIPVKSVKDMNINRNGDKVSHGCIVGCPKDKNYKENPIEIFSKLSAYNITYGTFIFIRNWNDMKQFQSDVNKDTLFYYLKLAHRKDFIVFSMRTKDLFNICINVTKISMEHIYEWRKYEFSSDASTSIATQHMQMPQKQGNKLHNASTYPIAQTQQHTNTKNGYALPKHYGNANGNASVGLVDEAYLGIKNAEPHDSYPHVLEIRNAEPVADDRYAHVLDAFIPDPDHNSNELTQLIDSPHGRLSVEELSRIKFRERNGCYVVGIPVSMPYAKLTSQEWFGQFGTITNTFLLKPNRNFHTKRASIIYDNEASALQAIQFCNDYVFDEGNRLFHATFNKSNYCLRFLLPHTSCKNEYCAFKHSWSSYNCESIVPEAQLKNSANSDFEKEILRKQMGILGKYIPVFPLNKVGALFFKYFDCKINTERVGGVKDLVLYFSDIFDIEMHADNGMHLVSKVFSPRYIRSNESKLQALKVEFGKLESKIKLYEKREQNECTIKFKHWLCNVVGLETYLSVFEENVYDNIQLIEFLSEKIVRNDLRISKTLHCKLLLKHVEQFKKAVNAFNQILESNDELSKFETEFVEHGIVTLKYLKSDIKTSQDVTKILHIDDKKKINCVLNSIRSLD